jgi:pyridoxal phosphate enzyme (YggS family)
MNQQDAILNLDTLITNIEKSRLNISEHHIVQTVAVSKYSTSKDILTLYNSGQRAFGENKVQDLAKKSQELEEYPISWHFIGSLQKNKINQLIDLNPILMHSLSSLELANELDKRLKVKDKKMNCLLQINSAKEDTKSGVSPTEAIDIYKEIKQNYTNINLIGIMSIGAHSEDKELIIKSFDTTYEIFETLQKEFDDTKICSMGMSGDYELAITRGSNMIRVGSALFK